MLVSQIVKTPFQESVDTECEIAAGALREALLIGYDHPRMEGLWPSEKQCPGFKYALHHPIQGLFDPHATEASFQTICIAAMSIDVISADMSNAIWVLRVLCGIVSGLNLELKCCLAVLLWRRSMLLVRHAMACAHVIFISFCTLWCDLSMHSKTKRSLSRGKSMRPVQTSVFFFCRAEMLEFMHMCHRVVEMLMECFARGLGLQEDFFKHVSITCCAFPHCILASLLNLCNHINQELVDFNVFMFAGQHLMHDLRQICFSVLQGGELNRGKYLQDAHPRRSGCLSGDCSRSSALVLCLEDMDPRLSENMTNRHLKMFPCRDCFPAQS